MKRLEIMVCGLPGDMPSLVAAKISHSDGLMLDPIGLSHNRRGSYTQPDFGVFLVPAEDHETAIRKSRPDIIADFSRNPEANCERYCRLGVPFVMGATGGDRAKMEKMVKESGISAVIAPNMAPEIVLIQAMLEFAADNFPGALSNYILTIAESHQAKKLDVSGTALAFEKLLNKIGAVSNPEGILSIRDIPIQKRLCGIPEEYLDRHAYHEYVLESGDKNTLGLVHHINGRESYVQGTILAIRFLGERLNSKGSVFSMVDVLRNLNSRF